jgi:hypothetical protein
MKLASYKLNIERDVDMSSGMSDQVDYILNLPDGFRFIDDLVHVRGYDSLKELKAGAKNDTIPCNCLECTK